VLHLRISELFLKFSNTLLIEIDGDIGNVNKNEQNDESWIVEIVRIMG